MLQLGFLMAKFPKLADGFFLVQKSDSAIRILFNYHHGHAILVDDPTRGVMH